MKYIPKKYQKIVTQFVMDNPRAAVHVDMGLGKTVAVLTALKSMLDNFRISGVIVFAPLRIVTHTWPAEIAKWDHLRNIDACIVRGTEEERIELLREKHEIYIINYEMIPWIKEWLVKNKGATIDTMVLDESSKMKSGSSLRFKKFKILSNARKIFPRVIEMTGTPMPEKYENLWSQFFILDQGKRLMPFMGHFKSRWMIQNQYNRFDIKMREGADVEIQKLISDITITLRAEDWLDLPSVIVNDIQVILPKKAAAIYKEMEDEMVVTINKEDVIAGSSAIVNEKCRQVCAGFIYSRDEDGLRKSNNIHTEKLDMLEDILEATDEHFLVAFWYEWEMKQIKARWKNAPILGTGVTDAYASKSIDNWNKGKTKVLFMHPQSVGHGINLQDGGHNILFLSIPWSFELYDQTIHRLQRMGQNNRVVVHRLIVKDSVDVDICKSLNAKDTCQKTLMKNLATRRSGLKPGVSHTREDF